MQKNYSLANPTVGARAEHFALVEAKKLWAADVGIDRIANVPAGLLIQATLSCNGVDKEGHQYLAGAVRIAQNLGFFRVSTAERALSSGYPHVVRGRAVIAWALYRYQS